MVRRRGPRLTLAQKAELWRRWRQGESLNAIGRALGRIPKMVRYEVARTGGIPPPARHRARRALTLTEREAISRGLARGTSLAADQPPATPDPLDRESGGATPRRPAPVSRHRGGCGGVGAWPTAETLSLGATPCPA